MTINARLIQAVAPIVPICVPNFYGGDKPEYTEFNISTEPSFFADDKPTLLLHTVYLRWYLPVSENAQAKKSQLEKALCGAGFDIQYIADIGDEISQGYEFRMEYAEVLPEEDA